MRKQLVFFLLSLFLMTSCAYDDRSDSDDHLHHMKNSSLSKKGEEGAFIDSLVPVIREITIGAIGDLLIHSRVYQDAQIENGYDFMPILEPVADYLQRPTITIANQETIIGGAEIGLSTYPRFNSPYELANNLKDVGIDLVTMANNHTLDRGEVAVQNAIVHYEKIGMEYTGSFKNEEDRKRIRVLETEEDISVAFLSYTYGTNGIPIPSGKEYLVNLINYEQIKNDVQQAKQLADATVLSYHFGNEYERYPSAEQRNLAQFAADLGVEVIIGHHPHVLQPLEWIDGKYGGKTLVVYSLGNFLSGQQKLYRRIGGIFQFSVEKIDDEEGGVRIHSPAFLPTFVQYSMNGRMHDFSVRPLNDVKEEQLPNVNQHVKEIKEHMSQWLPELKFMNE